MASRRGKGEGSISQTASGTWRAQICLQGKRYSKTFESAASARRWLRKLKSDSELGYYEYEDILLSEYLDQWFPLYQPTLRPRTAQDYQRYLNRYIHPHLGKIKLGHLSPLKIDQYYRDLMEIEGKSSITIRHIHRVLHRALAFAVEKRVMPMNPAQGATLPESPRKEMSFLSPDEARRFLEVAKGSPYELIFYLAIKTGMRQAELFGLQWKDVNWLRSTLHVRRQVHYRPGGEILFSEPKTKAGIRTIPLSNATLNKIRAHKTIVDRLPELTSQVWQDHDLIMPTQAGTPHYQGNIRKIFKTLLTQAGLKIIRFHDLRHTAASIMLNAGLPIIQVSRMLGHASVSITLDTYGHFIPSMHHDAADQLDAILNLDE